VTATIKWVNHSISGVFKVSHSFLPKKAKDHMWNKGALANDNTLRRICQKKRIIRKKAGEIF
jgi:hypothetical protein